MAEERVERRLAAVLAGDVAGYSRLMGADEEGTLKRLNAHRREFLEPKITEHRGRIVKRTGDGVLVEFASAVDAGRCAVEIQRGMDERNKLASLRAAVARPSLFLSCCDLRHRCARHGRARQCALQG